MGFDDLGAAKVDLSQCQEEITTIDSPANSQERTSSNNSSLDSSIPESESSFDAACCIRDLDSGKRYVVQNGGHDGLTSFLKEVATDKVLSLLEFESLVGVSRSVQKLLRRAYSHSPARETKGAVGTKKMDIKSVCKNFMKKRSFGGICKSDVHVKSSTTSVPSRTKVQHRKKKNAEFSAVYIGQEIRAHDGLIRVMKFSPSGWYLATGGEDCVVRVWKITEVDAYSKMYGGENHPHEYVEKIKILKPKQVDGQSHTLTVVPNKGFHITESPLHEFHGHTGDVLDMTWSKSDVSFSLDFLKLP
jgi:WD40 repeat protein